MGGQGLVDPDMFRGFDHVALGHLHRPQVASGRNRAEYSGSLLPYSFSEADHSKSSLRLVLENGEIASEPVPHIPRREFSILNGRMKDLLENERYSGFRDHYLSVILTDKGFLVDIQKQLMERFPHVLEIDQPSLHIEPSEHGSVSREEADDPSTLFSLFLDRFQWDERRERAMEIFNEIRRELERKEVRS
ncbi:MAG: exonuclease SbcCD subunit D C-terminal domain-containing protein [Thermoplasmatota archaeon]